MTAFSLDWLKLRVLANRFTVETDTAPLIRMRDFLVRTFGEFLNHTPITQMGINRSVHFSVGTVGVRDKIGRILAPREPWGDWRKDMEGEPGEPETVGGLTSLSMTQKDRKDGHAGAITAKVEPSTQPNLALNGIFMEVNDHYILGGPQTIVSTDAAISLLKSEWDQSIQRSEQIIDQIMALKDHP